MRGKGYNRNAQNKAFELSLLVVKVCRKLGFDQKEIDLSRQLMRSGTSIGANLEEAIGSQTQKEIYHRIHIAYREARESKYWVRILTESRLIDKNSSDELLNRLEELLRILGASISTMKKQIS